jgi:hypothetical protein
MAASDISTPHLDPKPDLANIEIKSLSEIANADMKATNGGSDDRSLLSKTTPKANISMS